MTDNLTDLRNRYYIIHDGQNDFRFLNFINHMIFLLAHRQGCLWTVRGHRGLKRNSGRSECKNKPKELILISPYSDPFQYRIINNRCFQTDDLLRRVFKSMLIGLILGQSECRSSLSNERTNLKCF